VLIWSPVRSALGQCQLAATDHERVTAHLHALEAFDAAEHTRVQGRGAAHLLPLFDHNRSAVGDAAVAGEVQGRRARGSAGGGIDFYVKGVDGSVPNAK
jgi:hypothetical protein